MPAYNCTVHSARVHRWLQPTCTASLMHMQVPSTLVLIISTQLAVLPLNRLASLRLRPALLTCRKHRQAGAHIRHWQLAQALQRPSGSCAGPATALWATMHVVFQAIVLG
jgi:hypothetical protein